MRTQLARTQLDLAYDNVETSLQQIQATVARITTLIGDAPALPSAAPADRANYEHHGYADLHDQNCIHPSADADPANAWLQAVQTAQGGFVLDHTTGQAFAIVQPIHKAVDNG